MLAFISLVAISNFLCLINKVITNSVEQRRSWEALPSSGNQEISRIICNPKFHYRVHKSPPRVPILSQNNPIQAPPSSFLKSYFNMSPLLGPFLISGALQISKSKPCMPVSSLLCNLHTPPISFAWFYHWINIW